MKEPAKRLPSVCDSCLTAIYDEGGHGLTRSEQTKLAIVLGADVADHCCEATEEPGTECACACHQKGEE